MKRRCYHAHKVFKTPLERITEHADATRRYMEQAVIQMLNLPDDNDD